MKKRSLVAKAKKELAERKYKVSSKPLLEYSDKSVDLYLITSKTKRKRVGTIPVLFAIHKKAKSKGVSIIQVKQKHKTPEVTITMKASNKKTCKAKITKNGNLDLLIANSTKFFPSSNSLYSSGSLFNCILDCLSKWLPSQGIVTLATIAGCLFVQIITKIPGAWRVCLKYVGGGSAVYSLSSLYECVERCIELHG
jgi:hypothetical protein